MRNCCNSTLLKLMSYRYNLKYDRFSFVKKNDAEKVLKDCL